MRGYLLRRLLLAALTLLGISVLVAGMMRTLPGDVVDVLAAEAFYDDREKERLREELGLEDPFFVYFGKWLGAALQGDFGESLRTQRSVGDDLARRLDVTMELAILGLIIATMISVPLGILAALRRSQWPDYVARSIAVFALAIPGFWLATLAVVFGAKWFSWSPPLGYQPIWEAPFTNLQQMWLPALLFGLILAGVQTRILRTALLDVLRQDYMLTARAKGLSRLLLLRRHALRNSLIPFVTVIGVQFPVVLGGAVVFELIFALPGLGAYLLDGIANRDYVVVQAVNVWIAGAVIITNLLVDVSYGFLDPRIRVGA